MLMMKLLARMPDLRQRVQTEHVPDEHGHCRDCREAQWPCELYQIAVNAERFDTMRLRLSA